MATSERLKVGVIGASGYTGADLIRLALAHPAISLDVLAAKTHAGKPMGSVFPHLGTYGLPDLVDSDDVDWNELDAVFCGLPHGTAHQIISTLPDRLKVIDMSADFRLRDAEVYRATYGLVHEATDLMSSAVYGLTEHYRADISDARLVACPGCYPTATLMALLPLVSAGQVDADDLIVDAKSGVSGAGRALKQNTLFTEAGEGLSPYAVGTHRHAPEIEQEVSRAAGQDVTVNFTPHLIPMSRGELVTCYVRLTGDATPDDLRATLATRYDHEPFVHVMAAGVVPATQNVRGSNHCHIGVFADRIASRAIVIATLDNLVKGSAGQALQNFNLMCGLDETTGLSQVALFP
ncbi:MAG: N-acetyl-gamma-glutamyl-phosphate reductase [Pseudomonadota bacterium]